MGLAAHPRSCRLTIHFISVKKDETAWILAWCLDAYRRWLTMREPRAAQRNGRNHQIGWGEDPLVVFSAMLIRPFDTKLPFKIFFDVSRIT
jgi:hypothetical protein